MLKYFVLLTVVSLIFVGCSQTSKTTITTKPVFNDNLPEFDLQAHRGGRGTMPENTTEAMVDALGTAATTLEMDVVVTKNGKVILSHEPFFNHEITTLPNGDTIPAEKEREYNIYKMDYPEVIKYDVGRKPHPRFPQQKKMPAVKPQLADVFARIGAEMQTRKRPMFFYNIEVKSKPETDGKYHPPVQDYVEKVIAVVDAADLRERVIIQSFDFRVLQNLHARFPEIKNALLIEKTDMRSFRKQLDDLGFMPTIYSPDESLVTANLIEECHKRNIRIIPWTVNDPARFRALKKLGVDGIITDYPSMNF